MTGVLFAFLIGFAPGVFWLWIIYNRDKCQPEPRRLIIRTYLLGIAVAIPIAIIETFLYPGEVDPSAAQISLGTAAYLSFIVAGVTEETGKFLIVRGTIYRSDRFDEPIDGIVYAAAVALGFASIENVGYVMQYGVEVMLLRGPVSTLSHAVFSSFWGYPLAMRKVGLYNGRSRVVLGLLTAIVIHGLFNFTIFAGETTLPWFLGIFAAGVIVFFLMIRHARRIPAYRCD